LLLLTRGASEAHKGELLGRVVELLVRQVAAYSAGDGAGASRKAGAPSAGMAALLALLHAIMSNFSLVRTRFFRSNSQCGQCGLLDIPK